ncbi:hypothetical protein GCM10010517_76590 [Streptosporangium fragile]|uniref:Uncharacterized protein n=2 Tax=Streptosporangium fragile TaxID=46186 RepID=A0ABN3WBD8_9ACTN
MILLVGSTGCTTSADPLPTPGKLPTGFLLYEAEARKPVARPEEGKWTINEDLGQVLEFNPCNRREPFDVIHSTGSDRVSARTISYTAAKEHRSEQVVIYYHEAYSLYAYRALLDQLGECDRVTSGSLVVKTSSNAALMGDRAARVVTQAYNRKSGRIAAGGRRIVIAQEGAAIMIYTHAGEYTEVRDGDFSRQLKDAGTMATVAGLPPTPGKICSLPDVC